MNSFAGALHRALARPLDGDEPIAFERLDLPPPRIETVIGEPHLIVDANALEALSERAYSDLSFRIRPSLARDLAHIAAAQDASELERFAAAALLQNAMTAAEGRFPLCQDTGTAAAYGWRGHRVLVAGGRRPAGAEGAAEAAPDEAALAAGMAMAWERGRLRASQVLPLPAWGEAPSRANQPLAAELFSAPGMAYRFLFVAKGGGSSNKTALFQETKAVLRPEAFRAFARRAIAGLGVSACPPYRIALVVGGQSPEEALLAAKLAGCGALDALPAEPPAGGGPYRDRGAEGVVMEEAAASGWGAQFGGRYLARDARVIRLPRHAASLPIALAVSCVAHRQLQAYVDEGGYYIERLANLAELCAASAELRADSAGLHVNGSREPAAPAIGACPEADRFADAPAAEAPAAEAPVAEAPDTEAPAAESCATKSTNIISLTIKSPTTISSVTEAPAAARLGPRRLDLSLGMEPPADLKAGELVALHGPVVLARDAAHARLRAMIERGECLPAWTAYPAFYASPSGAPDGAPTGSLGPTTARRMDGYAEELLSRGAFRLMLGKGERGAAFARVCGRYGGLYLAAVGGAAALAAERYVRSSRIIDWPELEMEAIRLVELQGLPALVAVDASGVDFYERSE